jgi:hypothetical protein
MISFLGEVTVQSIVIAGKRLSGCKNIRMHPTQEDCYIGFGC